MKVIICEKPSVAREFAAALGVKDSQRHNGYIENDEWVITWAIGHLVALSTPDKYDESLKKWSFDTLPFVPDHFKYEIINDVKDQFKIIKSILQRPDVTVIYNAGDSAREGEYIQRLIFQEAKPNPNAKMMRIWIDSQTEAEIRRGIQEAKPATEYDNLAASAYERAVEDYLVGMNFSRACSLKYGNNLNFVAKTAKYIPFSVGRVMTCTMGMIVDKENQIRNFKEKCSYGISGITQNEIVADWAAIDETSSYFQSPLLSKEDAFLEKEQAEQLCSAFQQNGKMLVADIKRDTESKKAPLLFNLTELQAECSKRFKISPDETLSIAQSLYEKKLTTYPRTDARVLSTAILDVITENIKGLSNVMDFGKNVDYILSNHLYQGLEATKYVNDAQISDHYAIIPTGQISGINSLKTTELKVFELIVRRFLSIFYPAAEYSKIKVVFSCNQEKLFSSAVCLKTKGYLEVAGYNEDAQEDKRAEYNLLSSLNVGEQFSSTFGVTEKKSAKPKRYTSGSIMLAMENAGKLITDEELREQIKTNGIGTTATRSDTLKKLIKNNYVRLDEKTQALYATELGELMCAVLKETIPTMLNPEFTANWEKGLSQIADGKIDASEYRSKIVSYVQYQTNAIKTNDKAEAINSAMDQIHQLYGGKPIDFTANKQSFGDIIPEVKCPCCGGLIQITKWGYKCEHYKDSCSFTVGEICGTKVPKAQLVKILKSGESDKMKFTKKAGGTFEATLTLQNDEARNTKKIWLKPWN